MFTIENLIQFSKSTGHSFRNFPLISQRKNFLREAIKVKTGEQINKYSSNRANWTPEIAKYIFKELIEKKYVSYDNLLEKYDKHQILSLIEHNFVQFRPCPSIVSDFESK